MARSTFWIATAVIVAWVTFHWNADARAPQSRDVNASETPGHQGEVSIAVDRYEPDRLLAAAMDIDDGRLLTMSSADGGQTFRRMNVPLSGVGFHADPMVAFDSEGTTYLAHIPVASGNRPVGIEVARLGRDVASWAPSMRVSGNLGKDDKVAIAVDDERQSPFRDRVYVAWKWPGGGVFSSRSMDSGLSFTPPLMISDAAVSGLDLATDRHGDVYLAVYDHDIRSIAVYRSKNGGESFSPSVRVAPVLAEWYSVQPSHCLRQSLVHASVAADRSPGSRGAIYVTWSDYAAGTRLEQCGDLCSVETSCHTDVFLSRSVNGGRSWSLPVVVHERNLGRSDQYFSWIDVDPRDGNVYVAYKDSRIAPTRLGTDTYLNRSTDQGLSWESSIRLSSESSFARTSGFQYGDYQGLAVADGQVYAAWSDYRPDSSGTVTSSEIFVGRASFEPTSSGWRLERGSETLELSLTAPTEVEQLVDVYLVFSSTGDAAPSFLTPSGTTSERVPFETFLAKRELAFSTSIPLWWIPSGTLLTAVVVPYGLDPGDGQNWLSSEVRIPGAELVASEEGPPREE